MKRKVTVIAIIALLPPLAWSARAQEKVPLPEGEGKALVEAACAHCHELGAIFMYNGDDRRWEIMVHDMIAFGAPLSPQERDRVLEYLKASFSTDRVTALKQPVPPQAGKGAEVFQASCGGCHGTMLIARKRADRPGWAKIVEQHASDDRVKLSSEQTDALVSYLAAAFRPATTAARPVAPAKPR